MNNFNVFRTKRPDNWIHGNFGIGHLTCDFMFVSIIQMSLDMLVNVFEMLVNVCVRI